MTSPQHSYILDLSTYLRRLLRQGLWALIPAVVALGALLPWALTAPVTYEAKAAVTAYPPTVTSAPEATQQASLMGDIAAVDLITAQQSPEVAEIVLSSFPELKATDLRTNTEVKVQGKFGMIITITGESAEKAADIANAYATAVAQVLTESRSDEPPALQIVYRQSLSATKELALPLSSKTPRLIISAGVAVMVWLGATAALDARAQMKRRRHS